MSGALAGAVMAPGWGECWCEGWLGWRRSGCEVAPPIGFPACTVEADLSGMDGSARSLARHFVADPTFGAGGLAREIVLFRHSRDDGSIVKNIGLLFRDNRVTLVGPTVPAGALQSSATWRRRSLDGVDVVDQMAHAGAAWVRCGR